MDWALSLWILCSATGLVLVVGILFLIWKGLIDVHLKGREVTATAAPQTGGQGDGKQGEPGSSASADRSTKISFLGFKMNTEFPVLIMFFLGFVMLIYPVYNAKNICPNLSLHQKILPEMGTVKAKVNSPIPIDIYAVVDQKQKIRSDVTLNAPLTSGTYRLMYVYNNELMPLDPFELKSTVPQELKPIEVQVSPASTPKIADQTRADAKEVADYKNEVPRQ